MAIWNRKVSWLAALLSAVVVNAHAAWPERPVRIVVPYPAGAAGDLVIRYMQPMLQTRLGQPVVVENKAGAGGNIGVLDVVRSRPDGYSFVLGATNNFVINQYLYKSLGFDPLKALDPVTKVVDVPSVLFINAAVPARSYREFSDYVRNNPGKLNFGSPGSGTAPHLSGFALSEFMEGKMTHVAYRGAQPGVVGLLGNEVQMFLVGYGVAGPHVNSGRIRALFVAADERLKALPDVPTASEVGLAGVVQSNWWGLAAPKGTDKDILSHMAEAFRAVLALPATQQFLLAQGFTSAASTPETFQHQLLQESVQWKAVVMRSGATID